MRKRTFCVSSFIPVFSLIACLLLAGVSQAAEGTIAVVLTVVPGATVTRDGQTEDLRQHFPLRVSDVVSTNATGRVRILFNDDSTVNLGSNTSLDLREFADSGDKPVFNVHLLQGVARVVTGKIVEQNPGGFAVSTPEATIGIRGTILSARSENGRTTTFVENTTRAVYVNDINVPGGNKITFPGDSRPSPIQPEDRRSLGRDLAFRGGGGAAAAAPEPSSAGQPADTRESGATAVLADAGLPVPESSLAGIALGTQTLGDSLTGSGGLPVTPPTARYAHSGAHGDFSALNFGFNVDLGSGAISNGYMNGTGMVTGTTFSLTGGTNGGGSFGPMIKGFTGTPHDPSMTAISLPLTFTPGDPTVISSVFFSSDGISQDQANSVSASKIP